MLQNDLGQFGYFFYFFNCIIYNPLEEFIGNFFITELCSRTQCCSRTTYHSVFYCLTNDFPFWRLNIMPATILSPASIVLFWCIVVAGICVISFLFAHKAPFAPMDTTSTSRLCFSRNFLASDSSSIAEIEVTPIMVLSSPKLEFQPILEARLFFGLLLSSSKRMASWSEI